MRSESELRQRIQAIYDGSERLDNLNYIGGRFWLADYAADCAVVADCMLELLDGAAVPECVFGIREEATDA